ncbi:hypothetical protein ACEUAH_13480, partial [Aeromonas caviae]
CRLFFGHANEDATRAGSCNRQRRIKRRSSPFSCQVTLGERLPRAVDLSMEKYCSVSLMLEKAVEITHSYQILEG